MSNKSKATEKRYLMLIISSALFGVTTALFIFIFAALITFCKIDFGYATLFATVSIAAGVLVSSYYLGFKHRKKGLIVGFVSGLCVFIIFAVLAIAFGDGGFTYTTLFRFIIFTLSGIVGAVIGVNKSQKKKYTTRC